MSTAELKALHDELNMLLKTVPGKAVSASKVQAVAKACFHARGEYKRAVYAVEQFIKKAPAHCRLAGVYAIDAVCRRAKAQLKDKDPFSSRFGKEILVTLQGLDAASLEDRQRLVKVVCEWSKQKLFGDVDFNGLSVVKRTRDESREALDRAEQKASPRARSPSPEKSRFSSEPPPQPGPYAGQPPPRGFPPQGFAPQGFSPGPPPGQGFSNGPPPGQGGFSNGPPQGMPPRGFPPQGFPPHGFQQGGPPQMLQPIGNPGGGFAPPRGFAGPPQGMQPGDWRCPQCQNVNFSRRDTCNRCNAPKLPGSFAGPYAGQPPPAPVVKEPLVDRFEDDDEAFESGLANQSKRPPNVNGQRRTKMCMAIQEGRSCRFGQACTYAHSTAELELGSRMGPADPNARREDGSLKWQPHLRKTKLCKFFMERGGDCPYGPRCNFAHGEAALESARPASMDFVEREGLEVGFESRGGFESRIDRSRENNAAPPPMMQPTPPPPPPPPPPPDEDDAWSDGSLEATDDFVAKRPRLG